MQGRSFEVRASDGRALRARVAGPEDGALVVYHSGTPGTNNLYADHVEAGAERGLRHVCCSRPGYGGSERQPGRSISACATDIAAVADALSAERFYVVGHSGGAPHALACAALLPDRVIAAASLSGFAPRQVMGDAWQTDMADENVEEFDAAVVGGAGLDACIRVIWRKWGKIKTLDHLREEFQCYYNSADRDALLVDANLRFQLFCIEQIAAEEIWGWFDDDRAIVTDWGFAIEDIEVPISIWHGEGDPTVPSAHGVWLTRQIPGAHFNCLPGEGHMSFLEHSYGAILDELIEIGA